MCVWGEKIPQAGQGVLIYGLLPFSTEYKPELMHRMVLFRLVKLQKYPVCLKSLVYSIRV